jgi:hypothetical protein
MRPRPGRSGWAGRSRRKKPLTPNVPDRQPCAPTGAALRPRSWDEGTDRSPQPEPGPDPQERCADLVPVCGASCDEGLRIHAGRTPIPVACRTRRTGRRRPTRTTRLQPRHQYGHARSENRHRPHEHGTVPEKIDPMKCGRRRQAGSTGLSGWLTRHGSDRGNARRHHRPRRKERRHGDRPDAALVPRPGRCVASRAASRGRRGQAAIEVAKGGRSVSRRPASDLPQQSPAWWRRPRGVVAPGSHSEKKRTINDTDPVNRSDLAETKSDDSLNCLTLNLTQNEHQGLDSLSCVLTGP